MVDLPKAIEWLEKGMLYCELYSAYELALIYLYNDDYKNVERGLMCLERCVEGDYIEGIEGLANVYFNGDLVEEDMSRAKQLLEKALELVREMRPIVWVGCMNVAFCLKNRIM